MCVLFNHRLVSINCIDHFVVCHTQNAYILHQYNLSLLVRAVGWREIIYQIFQNQDPPSSISYTLTQRGYMMAGEEKKEGDITGRLGFETHMHFLMSALKKLRCIYISREEKGRSVWALFNRQSTVKPIIFYRIQTTQNKGLVH